MDAITTTALRNKMKEYLDRVSKSAETIFVTRGNDDDAVVLMPMREYNAMIETNYLLSSEINRKRLEESIAQVNAGQLVPFNLEDIEKPQSR